MTSAEDVFWLSPRERARRCLELATEARASAESSNDPELYDSYRRIAGRWVKLAAEAEMAARNEETPEDDDPE